MNKASVQNTLDQLFWKIPQHVKQLTTSKKIFHILNMFLFF